MFFSLAQHSYSRMLGIANHSVGIFRENENPILEEESDSGVGETQNVADTT